MTAGVKRQGASRHRVESVTRRGSYAKGVLKREEILLTALDVIASHGYRRASVRDLAEAVGLSQAGLLHYFDSKEELFTSVLRKRDEVNLATVFRDGGELPDPAVLLENYVELIRHRTDVPGLVQLHAALAAESADASHPSHEYFAQRLVFLTSTFAEVFTGLQVRGAFAAGVDAAAFAVTLVALVDGLQVQWMHDPGIDMPGQLEHLLALVIVPGSERATPPAEPLAEAL